MNVPNFLIVAISQLPRTTETTQPAMPKIDMMPPNSGGAARAPQLRRANEERRRDNAQHKLVDGQIELLVLKIDVKAAMADTRHDVHQVAGQHVDQSHQSRKARCVWRVIHCGENCHHNALAQQGSISLARLNCGSNCHEVPSSVTNTFNSIAQLEGSVIPNRQTDQQNP